MKKTISVILTAMIMLSTLFGAYSMASDFDGIPDSAFDYIAERLRQREETINVSQFSLSVNQLRYIVQHVKLNDPYVFFIENAYSYYSNQMNNTVSSFLPRYTLNSSEISSATEYINGKLNEIISKVPNGLGDRETALFLHDYIVLNFAYDETSRSDNIYSMLQGGTGTCEAYTGLYIALLKLVGISAYGVTSIEKSHAWCEVQLGGKWYYADVTWDDPTPDSNGWVSHKELFLSESAIKNHGSDFEPRHPVNDTKYDGKLWHQTITPFAFVEGIVYGLDVYDNGGVYFPGFNICRYDLETGSSTPLYTINDVWKTKNGTGYWVGCYSGFGSFKDKLIFNGPKEIRFLDLSTGEVKTLLTVDGSNDIYKLYTNGNTLYYITADDPNMTNEQKQSIYLPTAFNDMPVGVLSGLEIVTAPNKTEYQAGDEFDPVGMKVKAVYSDGTSKNVTTYSCSSGKLDTSDTEVTVSYTEGSVTVTAKQTIKVSVNYSCGDGLEWEFDESTGTLTVTGEGYMYDYGDESKAPWTIYCNDIKSVELSNSVNSIGMYAFSSCTQLESVIIPTSVTEIGIGAFNGCRSLNTIFGPKGSYAEKYARELGISFVEKVVYIPGDINNDGEVSDSDVDALFKYLSMWNVDVVEKSLDVNGDGLINNKDLVRLVQYLSGSDVKIN